MRPIAKGAPPPDLVATAKAITTNLTSSAGARDAFNQIDKATARQALATEQRCLCAFCGRRVSPTEQDAQGQATMKIAHRTPIAVDSSLALTWNNLLGCCRGGEGTPMRTCDTAQENAPLTLDPTRNDHAARILYGRQETRGGLFIRSDDAALQHDVAVTLNLNAGDLPHYRESAWKALLVRAQKGGYPYGKPGRRQCLADEAARGGALGEYFGVLEAHAR